MYFFSATKQAEVQKTIDELKHEVDKRDLDIKILQKNLKEAENVLVGRFLEKMWKTMKVTGTVKLVGHLYS